MPMFVTQNDYDRIKLMIQDKKNILKDLRKEKAFTSENCGDLWHDNPAFSDMESKERILIREINELNEKLNSVQIVEINTQSEIVEIGKKLMIVFEDGIIEQIEIVGHLNGQPPKKIAYDSPIGQAIMGAKANEIRKYTVGTKEIKVKIKEIYK